MSDPIELGSMLFTMVEPHRGHEVAYNRWYERDHFYAGCMIGEYTFSGQRWVATRELKAVRYPQAATPITPDPSVGSYLALYWILAGHYDEWNRWAVDQVKQLHADGRMFAERDHIHTLMYRFDWAVRRDDDGVPAELALDHRFPGLVVVVGDAADGETRAEVDGWYRHEFLPASMPGSDVALALCFTPQPLLADAPGVPKEMPVEGRYLHLYFLDRDADVVWPDLLTAHQKALDGHGTVVWGSPFKPTIPGTDAYTDQLW